MRLPAGLMLLHKTTAPALVQSGRAALYFKSDGLLYTKSDDGIERANNQRSATFSRAGNLVVLTGTLRFPVGVSGVIDSVSATLNTVPTGSAAILDIKKNGSSIYGVSGNRPTFAIGSNNAVVGTHSVTTVGATDYLTVDIVQIGSTQPGADLVVNVLLKG